MDKENVVDKTLEKIKKEHIEPKSSWELSVMNVLEWVLWGILAILGSIVMLVIFNSLLGIDWDARQRLQWSGIRLFFFSLPPFWLILLIAALALAFFGFRSTKYGYRYSASKIFVITLLAILGISTLSYLSKIDEPMYRMMQAYLPGQQQLFNAKEKIWSQPEKGLLSGEIIAFDAKRGKILVEDFSGKRWEVSLKRNTIIPRKLAIEITGEKVKFIGEKTGSSEFEASEIRPWMRMGERMPGSGMMGGGMMKNRMMDRFEN